MKNSSVGREPLWMIAFLLSWEAGFFKAVERCKRKNAQLCLLEQLLLTKGVTPYGSVKRDQSMKALVALLTFTLCLLSPVSSGETPKPKVLVIESYHTDMYWDTAYRNGIKEVIGNQTQLHFFAMDTKRLPPSSYQERTRLAIAELDRVKPDIVILGDDNALNFVGISVLQRQIPLVFLGINNNPRNYFEGTIPKGMTGVLERPNLKRFLRFIRYAEPEWRKILILFDTSNTSKIYKEESYFFQNKNISKYLNIEVEVYFSSDLPDLKNKIKSAQNTHDALFLGGLNTVVDKNGQHVDWNIITEWIYQNSQLPLFTFWRGNVGFNKSIGGYVVDGREMGKQAAEIVERIIAGEEASDIPIEHLKGGELVLSRKSLRHWNLNFPDGLLMDAEFID